MEKGFDFKLDESARLAGELLEKYSGVKLDRWGDVVARWKAGKADLIAALDPHTGRRVVELHREVTPQDLVEALCGVLAGLHPQRGRCAEWGVTPSSRVFCCAVGRLQYYRHALTERGLSAVEEVLLGTRTGMKPTRALRKALLQDGARPEVVARVATQVGDALTKVRVSDGWVVLSANILDVLMASEHASFRSCHTLKDGMYRAGTQQYLPDRHTLVAYYYRDVLEYTPLQRYLPYKLWRRVVYIGGHRKVALFQKLYGTEFDGVQEAVVRLTETIIGPVVSQGFNGGFTTAFEATRVAYFDNTVCWVRSDGRVNTPRLRLYFPAVLCGSCGGNLVRPGDLVCRRCQNKGMARCVGCEQWYPESAMRAVGEYMFCADCYTRHTDNCAVCGERYLTGQLYTVHTAHGTERQCYDCWSATEAEGGGYQCDRCVERYLTVVPHRRVYDAYRRTHAVLCRHCAEEYARRCPYCRGVSYGGFRRSVPATCPLCGAHVNVYEGVSVE